MRKADLQKNHDVFEAKINRQRERMERLFRAQRVLWNEDKKQLAEGILLKSISYWEEFVDSELIDCVNIRSSKLKEFLDTNIPKDLPTGLCEAFLFRGGYLDFSSVGSLKGFSKQVLVETHNPFVNIESSTAKKLMKCIKSATI